MMQRHQGFDQVQWKELMMKLLQTCTSTVLLMGLQSQILNLTAKHHDKCKTDKITKTCLICVPQTCSFLNSTSLLFAVTCMNSYVTEKRIILKGRLEKGLYVTSDKLPDSPSKLHCTLYLLVIQKEKMTLHQKSLWASFCTPLQFHVMF